MEAAAKKEAEEEARKKKAAEEAAKVAAAAAALEEQKLAQLGVEDLIKELEANLAKTGISETDKFRWNQ
jgi:hypothetical protein